MYFVALFGVWYDQRKWDPGSLLGGENSMSKEVENSSSVGLKPIICVKERRKMWERTGLCWWNLGFQSWDFAFYSDDWSSIFRESNWNKEVLFFINKNAVNVLERKLVFIWVGVGGEISSWTCTCDEKHLPPTPSYCSTFLILTSWFLSVYNWSYGWQGYRGQVGQFQLVPFFFATCPNEDELVTFLHSKDKAFIFFTWYIIFL